MTTTLTLVQGVFILSAVAVAGCASPIRVRLVELASGGLKLQRAKSLKGSRAPLARLDVGDHEH